MRIQNLTQTTKGEPAWEKTSDGFLRCHCRVLASTVMRYGRQELSDLPEGYSKGTVDMLVPIEEMSSPDALRSLEGAPIVAGDHVWLTPDNIHEFGMGSVSGTPRIDGDYIHCDLLITDQQAIDAIEKKEIGEISAGYHATTDFTPGEADAPYDAVQRNLRFNHLAIIPAGCGRAGGEVRILNRKNNKETVEMTEKFIRVQLKNTGKFINVSEADAESLDKEQAASAKNVETAMSELEEKNGEITKLTSEADELKGELSVFKEKLDDLMDPSKMESAAAEMAAEKEDADEIVENASIVDENGGEDETKKEEIKNSMKGLFGHTLRVHVLNSIGVNTDGMNAEVVKGVFRAQNQIAKKGPARKAVAGAKMNNTRGQNTVQNLSQQRTALERLGFKVSK